MTSAICRWGVAVAAAGGLAPAGIAQFQFVEVAAKRGVQPYVSGSGYGTGVAAADIDDDGDIDFFVANGAGHADQVYRNDGTGQFEEVAVALGLASTGESRTALWVDFDGDGRLDLVVAGDCFSGQDPTCFDRMTLRFHRQLPTGAFEDITTAMGLDDDGVTMSGQHRAGIVAGDLNGDGWLDLLVGLWQGPALVLINQSGQGFVDAAETTGIIDQILHHWQPAIHDFDRDGCADVYWAADFAENHLWINQHDGTFVDVAGSLGVDNAMNDMGVALADYDNDGDFDIYITEIFEAGKHNVLYRNDTVDGQLAFDEVAADAGVDDTGFGWGVTFLDADNDGWLDLAVTNGWFAGIGYDDTSRFHRNLGGEPVVFEDRSDVVGFNDSFWGASLVTLDIDRDGAPDLLQSCNNGPVRLLDNVPDPATDANGWLVIKPRMDGPNVRAIGAIVRADVAGRPPMTRRISAGTGHLGQEPAEAGFGLGDAPQVDRLVIEWPDGAQTIRNGVRANQVLTVERSPCAGTADLDGDGGIGFNDLSLLLGRWGPCTVACPHDIDDSGSVGFTDLVELIGRWGPCGGAT